MENNKIEVRYITPQDVRVVGEDKHEFVLSTEAIDRHRTIIPVSEWNLDNYNKNGVVLLQHGRNWSVDSVLGSGSVRVEDGQLILSVDYDDREYNETAWKVKKKVEKGSLRATSVGFIANDYEWRSVEGENGEKVLILKDCELLEASIVDIPSNPEALKRDFDYSKYPENEEIFERSGRSANPYILINKFLKHKK